MSYHGNSEWETRLEREREMANRSMPSIGNYQRYSKTPKDLKDPIISPLTQTTGLNSNFMSMNL